jgi:hypothetical protein
MAVAYWSETMGADQDKLQASRKSRLMDAEIRSFLRSAGIGGPSRLKERSWNQTNRAFKS